MPKEVFTYPHSFELVCGARLASVSLTYHTYGALNPERNNVIWVLHALTANSEVADWWEGLFGENRILDPTKYFIVCVNMVGSCYGSTYALSENPETGKPYYHSFPLITNRDNVRAFDLLRENLGIRKILLGMGGSMGGQQLLEWAVWKPDVFDHIAPIATNAHHSPWGIAFNEAQRMAIQADASWTEDRSDAGLMGMRAARAIALLSYRSYKTYGSTQRDPNPTDGLLEGYRATTYQQYQGDKLVRRFDAFAYWTLSKAMDAHDVGRGQQNREVALRGIQSKALCVAISSDILFPPAEQAFLADHIPKAVYEEVPSMYGHDGFLIETKALNVLLKAFINSELIQNHP